MSQQVTIRIHGNELEPDFESGLLARAFQILEEQREGLGVDNFLGLPYTSNEGGLWDEIEEDLGGEPTEVAEYAAFEQNVEEELGRRGEFFDASELAGTVDAFVAFFESCAGDRFDLTERAHTTGADLASELRALSSALRAAAPRRARLVIG